MYPILAVGVSIVYMRWHQLPVGNWLTFLLLPLHWVWFGVE
jgi:hypothetical protein